MEQGKLSSCLSLSIFVMAICFIFVYPVLDSFQHITSLHINGSMYRLALKAFTDQKLRFFPHLADDSDAEPATKKPRVPLVSPANLQEELSDQRTVADFLSHLEKEVPQLRTSTYQRLDWLKQAFSLPSAVTQSNIESMKDHGFHSANQLRQGSADHVAADKVAVIELFFPSVFRAIISLHTAGSMEPDAVAFFSPDEVNSLLIEHNFSIFLFVILISVNY